MSDTTPPSAAAGTPDRELVRRLVTEVVQRLRGAAAANGSVPQGVAASATSSRTVSQPADPVSPPPSGSRYGAPESAVVGHVVSDAVVTLAVLERVPPGTRRVVVPARAVLTPSARERAVDAGIEIVRQQPAAVSAAAGRPFLVAQASCATNLAARAAGIVRAVAGAAHLPATGLADVLAALALHAGRDGARGVLLAGRPALAVAAANRHASLRAVTGHDAARVKAAAVECAANLLVLDPALFSATALERLCIELAQGPDLAAPAELVGGVAHSTPCGCRSAHH